jgi:hypothetical protein
MTSPSDRAWHQAETTRLLEAYAEATNKLAWQVQQQVERAGG